MTSIEKMDFLISRVEEKLSSLNESDTTHSSLREVNLKSIRYLYNKLELSQKHPDFSTIFDYSAMNLSGIGLKDGEFGKIREGKYVQLIAISYETDDEGERSTRNYSLGYYGKAEKLNEADKSTIIEFVLRWRYEKTFQHAEQYQKVLSELF